MPLEDAAHPSTSLRGGKANWRGWPTRSPPAATQPPGHSRGFNGSVTQPGATRRDHGQERLACVAALPLALVIGSVPDPGGRPAPWTGPTEGIPRGRSPGHRRTLLPPSEFIPARGVQTCHLLVLAVASTTRPRSAPTTEISSRSRWDVRRWGESGVAGAPVPARRQAHCARCPSRARRWSGPIGHGPLR